MPEYMGMVTGMVMGMGMVMVMGMGMGATAIDVGTNFAFFVTGSADFASKSGVSEIGSKKNTDGDCDPDIILSDSSLVLDAIDGIKQYWPRLRASDESDAVDAIGE